MSSEISLQTVVDRLNDELQNYKNELENQVRLRVRGEAELDAAKQEIERRVANIDKLESDQRMANAVIKLYEKQSERKRLRIEKLEALLRQLYAVNGLHVPSRRIYD